MTNKKAKETRAIAVARDVHVNVLLLAQQFSEELETICRTEDLSHAQYVALWRLCLIEDSEAGIPTSSVADGLLNKSSDTTRLVDRLERAGLVERLRNPADRRGVLVRATEEGRRRFLATTPKLQKYHETQWSHLTSIEIEQFKHLAAKALWGNSVPDDIPAATPTASN